MHFAPDTSPNASRGNSKGKGKGKGRGRPLRGKPRPARASYAAAAAAAVRSSDGTGPRPRPQPQSPRVQHSAATAADIEAEYASEHANVTVRVAGDAAVSDGDALQMEEDGTSSPSL